MAKVVFFFQQINYMFNSPFHLSFFQLCVSESVSEYLCPWLLILPETD